MLDLHLSLMLFVLVLFLILLVLLNTMLFQPLLKFMDDRDNSIAKDLIAAKSLSGNSDGLNAEADENISNAKNEAAAIRKDAIESEQKVSAQRVESKQRDLEKEYNKFAKHLATDTEDLKKALLLQVPQFKESLQAKFSKLS
jgi:F-type H+-transporting ATPase subunit b